MNELGVWKAVVEFGLTNRWQILCGCPPGSSSYQFPACMLLDGQDKIDAPDLIAAKDKDLIFVECKSSVNGLLRKNRNGESDVEKVLRLRLNAIAGVYDDQLKNNYSFILEHGARVFASVAYAGDWKKLNNDLLQFVVSKNLKRVELFGGPE